MCHVRLDNSVVESRSELMLPRLFPLIPLEITPALPHVISNLSEGFRKARFNLILSTRRRHIAHPIHGDYAKKMIRI